MKKFIAIISAFVLLQSCDNDRLTEINQDPNSYYTTVPSTLLTYAEKNLTDYITTPNVNTNNLRLTMQYWQEVTYLDESRYNFTSRNISNSVWVYTYVRTLKNLEQAKVLINAYKPSAAEATSWPTTMKNQLAIVDLLQVYTYQVLVDTYGDIPYKEALDVDKYPLPTYDKASDVYADLILRVKADLANMNTSGQSFASGEKIYNGNVSKWKKFGNSLLLKLGIGIADANDTMAKDAVNTAISGGVFTSKADDALLQYLSASPNYSQLYANLVASNRDDYVAGKTLIDQMNSTTDPRRSNYFQKTTSGVYLGGTIGAASSFSTYSHVGTFAYTATTPGIILNYTEVAFYLAEAAARWQIGGLPAPLYSTAVQASFNQWGYTPADAAAYLAANPFDPSNWKKSLGTQAWVAMYDQPMQAWNFYRRLDYPVLSAAQNAVQEAQGKVPVRLQYPISEQTTNPTNYTAASTAIGGDNLYTKIFWDKN